MRQTTLARHVGISPAAVSLWLNGSTTSIQGEHLTRAAAALGVDPHWLATGEGRMEPAAATEHREGERRKLDPDHGSTLLALRIAALPSDRRAILLAILSLLEALDGDAGTAPKLRQLLELAA